MQMGSSILLEKCPPDKAPRPDVQDFFLNGVMLPELNSTHLTLIPKIDNPSKVSKFRPISLCNVIYKLISKILAERLKLVLPKLISPYQLAFVPRKAIQDNYIVAAEIFHSMNDKQGRGGWIAIKVDMEKAYDRVEWSFVLKVLEMFGFNGKWIQWIVQCISTPSFAILINGSPFGNFCSSRGLRQGDPLLSSLFIICSEILSYLLLREKNAGHLKGVKVGWGVPSISHLLFTDDLLLFGKATLHEASILDECLEKYMKWSGQKVNRDKSFVHFSKKFHGQAAITILDQLGLKRLPSKAKHLGLPLLIPRAKGEVAAEIKEKFLNKIKGWKAKTFSQAGRTMMIKAVASTMPSYLWSFYSMPQTWCRDIDLELKNFWWGF
ncbi:hypothetical protein CJ030_MR7G027903 [Morella rubra]|uniref:Reverse transcriptase domain-containing protein n=1 Tax=Morella rubra TaxID=262757 RepID=A0A6A1UZU3_9ROSI|nr:hypothetical protein CJ030_MR7G027903 [Morella rubra]